MAQFASGEGAPTRALGACTVVVCNLYGIALQLKPLGLFMLFAPACCFLCCVKIALD